MLFAPIYDTNMDTTLDLARIARISRKIKQIDEISWLFKNFATEINFVFFAF